MMQIGLIKLSAAFIRKALIEIRYWMHSLEKWVSSMVLFSLMPSIMDIIVLYLLGSVCTLGRGLPLRPLEKVFGNVASWSSQSMNDWISFPLLDRFIYIAKSCQLWCSAIPHKTTTFPLAEHKHNIDFVFLLIFFHLWIAFFIHI